MSLRPERTRGRNRRGSLYLATLGAAMLVTILSLASVAVVRNLSAQSRQSHQLSRARHLNDSAVRVLQLLLENRTQWAQWRSLHQNGQWYRLAISGYEVHYCFVDEADGNLADDETQPVRLYMRSDSGEARYAVSVELMPGAAENLIVNGDFETGLVGWNVHWSLIQDVVSPGRNGGHCALVTRRDNWYNGIAQLLDTTAIDKGATYELEGYIRTVSDAESEMIATLAVVADATQYVQIPSFKATTSWRKFSGQVTLNWSGTLSQVRFYVENTVSAGEAPDYMLDDVVLRRRLSNIPLTPVPGTWRREVFAGEPPAGQVSPLP